MSQLKQKQKYPPPFALSSLVRETSVTTSTEVNVVESSTSSNMISSSSSPQRPPLPKRQKSENTTAATTFSTPVEYLNCNQRHRHPVMTDTDFERCEELVEISSGRNSTAEGDGSSLLSRIAATPAPSNTTTIAQKSIHDYLHRNAQHNDDNMDMKQPAKETKESSDCSNYRNIHMNVHDQPSVDNEQEVGDAPVVVDALSTYLTEDVIIKIMNFCTVSDLVSGIGMTNQYYHTLSCLDTVGWDTLYINDIVTKKCLIQPQRVSPNIPSPHANSECATNYRTKYEYAIMDSKRQCVTADELCYDSSGTVWSFRFKSAAGIDWTAADPWHQNQPCRKMAFLQNGTIMMVRLNQTSPPVVPEETTVTEAPTLTVASMWNEIVMNEQAQQNHHAAEAEEVTLFPPPLPMTWRFLTRPMDLPTRPMGSYIRIHVGSRDVPTYTCIRSPTNNWGFVFESCWGIYANFELPPKRITRPSIPTIALDANQMLQSTTNALSTATTTGNNERTIDENGETINRSDVVHGPIHDPVSLFPLNHNNRSIEDVAAEVIRNHQQPITVADMQDETMLLNNEIQWREAFLYNVGARILPEGDEATYEFDRFWQNSGTTNNTNNSTTTNNDANNDNAADAGNH